MPLPITSRRAAEIDEPLIVHFEALSLQERPSALKSIAMSVQVMYTALQEDTSNGIYHSPAIPHK